MEELTNIVKDVTWRVTTVIFSRTSKHKIYNMKSLHCHDLSSQSGNLGFEGREQSKEADYMGVPPQTKTYFLHLPLHF